VSGLGDPDPILVVGCPRSGTSLVRDLLRAHSRITFPHETRTLPRLLVVHGDPSDAAAARRLASDLLVASGVRRWGLALDIGRLEHHRSFGAMVRDLFAAWAAAEGKPRWGEKTPQYALHLPTMERIFPGAQIVHVIRDPRAVTPSLLGRPWGPATVRSAASAWRETVTAARRDGEPLGPGRYHELRYESLVEHPEPVLRELCMFLGERFEPAMLRPNRLPADAPPSWSADADLRIIVPPQADSALSARDRAAVAWEAGDLMQELGYPPGPRRPPAPGERSRDWIIDRAASLRFRLTAWDRRARAAEEILNARRLAERTASRMR
jgi:Sulfotransferase family